MIEEVILVDENNNPIGTLPKSEVHGATTPLHRAFSAFLFNPNGQLLLQQRSHQKKTWPLIWSNSVCGHPLPGEEMQAAILRRAKNELGLATASLSQIALVSNYRYCFSRFGVMENEICPIYIAKVAINPTPNPAEVENYIWMSWPDFLDEIRTDQADKWSEWCKEEAEIINKSNLLINYIQPGI